MILNRKNVAEALLSSEEILRGMNLYTKKGLNFNIENVEDQLSDIQERIGNGIISLDSTFNDVRDKILSLLNTAKNNEWRRESSILYFLNDRLEFLILENGKLKTKEYEVYFEKSMRVTTGEGIVYRNMGTEELELLLRGETIKSDGDFSHSKTGTPSKSVCFFHEVDVINALKWMNRNTVIFKVTPESNLKRSWGVYPDWNTFDKDKILIEFYCEGYNNKTLEIIKVIRE